MSEFIKRMDPWVNRLLAVCDPEERISFLEIINDRIHNGCVVRALESAFGVEATEEEWDMRIMDMRMVQAEFKPIKEMLNGIDDPILKERISLIKRVADRKRIMAYMVSVANHETPLGDALKRHNLSEDVLSLVAIRQAVESGNIVLADMSGRKARHLVHIGITDGEMVRLSDDGQKVNVGEEDKFAVYIFTPLEEAKIS